MKDRVPYTYLIGWSKYNIYYYGVSFRKGCHPDYLWVKYKTSSKHVHTIYKEYGDPDIIQVRRVFDDIESARRWETRVLERLCVKSEKFLNKHTAGGNWCNSRKITKSERIERSKRLTGPGNGMFGKVGELYPRKNYTHSTKTRENMRIAALNRDPVTQETRNKLSRSLKGKMCGSKNPMYNKRGELNPFFGKTHTIETKEKMSKAALKRDPLPREIIEKRNVAIGKAHKGTLVVYDIIEDKFVRITSSEYQEGKSVRFFAANTPVYVEANIKRKSGSS